MFGQSADTERRATGQANADATGGHVRERSHASVGMSHTPLQDRYTYNVSLRISSLEGRRVEDGE